MSYLIALDDQQISESYWEIATWACLNAINSSGNKLSYYITEATESLAQTMFDIFDGTRKYFIPSYRQDGKYSDGEVANGKFYSWRIYPHGHQDCLPFEEKGKECPTTCTHLTASVEKAEAAREESFYQLGKCSPGNYQYSRKYKSNYPEGYNTYQWCHQDGKISYSKVALGTSPPFAVGYSFKETCEQKRENSLFFEP